MVKTRTNFSDDNLTYTIRGYLKMLSEDIIPKGMPIYNKEIVSLSTASKVQVWNKVLVSLVRDPGKWSTIKWRKPQLQREDMLNDDTKLWVEKVVLFINYVQSEHGGKVMYTVDLSNSTYAHFLSANSAQSSSAGDQVFGTPCYVLSCHALDNTPVIPITDKYVPKLPTRDITSTQVKYIYGDDSIIEEELLDDVVGQKIWMSLIDNVRVMIIIYKDISGTVLKQDAPPTGTAPSAPRGIIQYEHPQLSTRENNSTEITCVHSDDSITGPSTVTDSYNTFDHDSDDNELSFFDALD